MLSLLLGLSLCNTEPIKELAESKFLNEFFDFKLGEMDVEPSESSPEYVPDEDTLYLQLDPMYMLPEQDAYDFITTY